MKENDSQDFGLVENRPVVNRWYSGEWDPLTCSNESSGAVTDFASASLLGPEWSS